MGDKENLIEVFGDAKDMTKNKRGRRVIITFTFSGFLAAVIFFMVFWGC